jgi:uncharacterized protein (TIGR02266 family)
VSEEASAPATVPATTSELEPAVESAHRRTSVPASDRSDPRHRVELEVNICSDSNFYAGFTENVSAGGVFVATYMIRPLGSRMMLEIVLPDRAEPLRLRGVVRWLRLPDANHDLWPGMGVEFQGMTSDDEQEVRRFLEHREPMFFDD